MVVDYAPPSRRPGASSGSGDGPLLTAPMDPHADDGSHRQLIFVAAASAIELNRPGNGTVAPTSPVKKMLFAEDRAEDTNAGLERQVGLGDASQFDSGAIVLRAWDQRARNAVSGDGFQPRGGDAGEAPKRRHDHTLTGIAPPSLPILDDYDATGGDMPAARLADESLKKTLGSFTIDGSSATRGDRARACAGEGHSADALTLPQARVARARASFPTPPRAGARVGTSCGAWLSFLPDVAQQASRTYGVHWRKLRRDGPAVAMRAVDAVAAPAQPHPQPPPADEESDSSAVRARSPSSVRCAARDCSPAVRRHALQHRHRDDPHRLHDERRERGRVERAVPRLVGRVARRARALSRLRKRTAVAIADARGRVRRRAAREDRRERPMAPPRHCGRALAASCFRRPGARHARDGNLARVSATSPLFLVAA